MSVGRISATVIRLRGATARRVDRRYRKASQNLFNRPLSMFRDERLGVVRRLLQGGQIVARADVAKRDADIPQEAVALDPLDGRIAKKIAKLGFAEFEI